MRPLSRRSLIRTALTGAVGVAAGVAGSREVSDWFGWDRPPVRGGYAAAADDLSAVKHADVAIRYRVDTTQQLVALTFDDGPAPQWTPMVLDALDAANVPATFFMVGENLEKHADLVRGRLARHEIGNHSWSHADLATLDLQEVGRELERTHEAIQRLTGRTPTLMRPPFGHLGGSTVLAAARMGYTITLWSEAMHEIRYKGDPAAQARYIVDAVKPGTIVLAHDEGDDRRLVTVRGLPAMFDGLRRRGFRFVTVSELLASATPSPGPAVASHKPLPG
ncbi:polysaccharide deacetylase family protein [Couchioplanes caeruleus]|uniref:Polysaccharide deacetylase n=2 Tax=Couchioplanes caeruleus TaxID=56438 RepID=A0A1K0FPP2_9ACTN|nr:polysaccharide deacetylase family protein [Couchioplanes caeruleus]OJF14813.1 polysaccharide deacetylase [Couchioplanes caeruleus subsp. caeruleus]ROP32265.1 peptidoglycan/xylan/chitin deacetylase (PgdA/CDA1 family) [Couchioplanes caeruleus]